MKKRRERKLFKVLPLRKIIPNLATISALMIGMTQINFALKEQWEYAVLAAVGAAFLDAMDGKIARILGSCSRFGAELDSLSDFAVFGICPAVVMYLFSLSKLNRLGWIFATFFAISMCLRLARFNTHDIENVKSPLSDIFFTGVPAPAGAILALFPVISYNAFELDFFKNEYFSAVTVVGAALSCISRIPTLSIKKFHVRREQYTVFLLCSVFIIGAMFAYTWKMFVLIVLAYIASIFITISRGRKILHSENDKTTSNKQL